MSFSKWFHADRKPVSHGVFSKRLGKQSSFLDVEYINDTSCSDFMKVAVPFVYKVGKNSSMNINYLEMLS